MAEPQIGINSFEQEKREVLESVMGAFCCPASDPDEMAACSYLLRHLTRMAGRRAA